MTTECECGGSGFRLVSERYVDKHAPWRPPPFPDPLDEREEAINEAVRAADELMRTTVANSVYPCPFHETELYDRWLKGDWPKRRTGKPRPDPEAAPPDDDEPKPVDWNETRKDLQ